MRNEPDRYTIHADETKIPNIKVNATKGWFVSFCFNCDSRERAEKIAQDKFYALMNLCENGMLTEEAIQAIENSIMGDEPV
jgi:hypothetical protein